MGKGKKTISWNVMICKIWPTNCTKKITLDPATTTGTLLKASPLESKPSGAFQSFNKSKKHIYMV